MERTAQQVRFTMVCDKAKSTGEAPAAGQNVIGEMTPAQATHGCSCSGDRRRNDQARGDLSAERIELARHQIDIRADRQCGQQNYDLRFQRSQPQARAIRNTANG